VTHNTTRPAALIYHLTFNVQDICALGRLRHRWDNNVKMDHTPLRKKGRGLDSSGLGQGQVVGSYECGNKP
jgi:hypothetical protein